MSLNGAGNLHEMFVQLLIYLTEDEIVKYDVMCPSAKRFGIFSHDL